MDIWAFQFSMIKNNARKFQQKREGKKKKRMLLGTFIYMCLCGHMFSFLLGRCLELELLYYMAALFLNYQFSKGPCTNLLSHLQYMWVLISLHPCQHLLLSVLGFSRLTELRGYKRIFIMRNLLTQV